MVTNKLVTVSVAMYNSEKYLEECIESLINQTYSNLEILLINDGSTDKTFEICKKYADKDSRIKIINKENGGLTSCRKLGTELSTGEYIIFPDSDDIMHSDYIQKLVCACEDNGAEVAICGYKKIGLEKTDNPIKTELCVIEKKDFIDKVILPYIKELDEDKTVLSPFCWNHLYKKNCLSDECFVNEKITTREDCYLNIRILDKINRIAVVKDMLYDYRINVNSMTNVYRENRFDKDMFFYHFADDYFAERKIDDQGRLLKMVSSGIVGNIDNLCKSGSYRVFRQGIKRMKSERVMSDAVVECINNSQSSAMKIAGILFSANTSLLLYLFRKIVLRSKGIK